ncbi:SDR family NAD(P)-dependent oxidoreductase [Streptomyces sp. NPDC015220]|uniref:SDR family NAD(P)-dependent oxidoreductase n=1 Tax=Streptomyces sp. NPDC015220 TaxID=3364947 RepID=UPI003700C650
MKDVRGSSDSTRAWGVPPVVLITGCSSGIGRAVARQAVSAGFTTVATARDPRTLRELQAAGCVVRPLDVTDDAARRGLVAELDETYGGVDALVNNAGYGELGPFEEVPPDRWERQFRTNVFGPVALAQLVLPGMRARGHGRIVSVSSMAGELVLPVGAAYHGSKFALEAAMEGLWLEARRFGIEVSLVQPGAVNSNWGDNVPALKEYASGVYGELVAEMTEQMARRLPRGSSVEHAASVVLRALTDRRPRLRYRVGVDAHVLLPLSRVLPARVWTAWVRKQFPSMRRPAPRPAHTPVPDGARP